MESTQVLMDFVWTIWAKLHLSQPNVFYNVLAPNIDQWLQWLLACSKGKLFLLSQSISAIKYSRKKLCGQNKFRAYQLCIINAIAKLDKSLITPFFPY